MGSNENSAPVILIESTESGADPLLKICKIADVSVPTVVFGKYNSLTGIKIWGVQLPPSSYLNNCLPELALTGSAKSQK
jgi:hypothetical protein